MATMGSLPTPTPRGAPWRRCRSRDGTPAHIPRNCIPPRQPRRWAYPVAPAAWARKFFPRWHGNIHARRRQAQSSQQRGIVGDEEPSEKPFHCHRRGLVNSTGRLRRPRTHEEGARDRRHRCRRRPAPRPRRPMMRTCVDGSDCGAERPPSLSRRRTRHPSARTHARAMEGKGGGDTEA